MTAPEPEPRNLVVFCDGTSNEVETDLSNVLKLCRIVDRNSDQLVFYHPGVGTVGLQRSWGHRRQRIETVFGLATGWGLDENILEAYRFLANNYRDRDRIFLFGFSRGAYTARAIAGMIHLIGLLRPEQLNLASYALTAYKRASSENSLPVAWNFQRIVDGTRVPIHFMGIWDTVATVIVPRRDRFNLPSLEYLPYTRSNPAVRTVRHACAIDERRRMFRLYNWNPDQKFQPDPFDPAAAQPQDAVQMWFAGDHSDVGGGHPESESSAAKFPLIWLAQEARQKGLQLRSSMFDHLALGKPLPGGRHTYVAPDALAPLHKSVRGFWHIPEWLPRAKKWRRWPSRGGRGLYLPRSEPRFIPDDAQLHTSVAERLQRDPLYRPVNLPSGLLARALALALPPQPSSDAE